MRGRQVTGRKNEGKAERANRHLPSGTFLPRSSWGKRRADLGAPGSFVYSLCNALCWLVSIVQFKVVSALRMTSQSRGIFPKAIESSSDGRSSETFPHISSLFPCRGGKFMLTYCAAPQHVPMRQRRITKEKSHIGDSF